MKAIEAKVSRRLLAKADRLFTGTLNGRIIEILQNARRAGATQVTITNYDGQVIVQDNGRGIVDFARLLDLGGSDWEEQYEAAEDPAGVGLFCLSPREVTIRSNGKRVAIPADGWTGAPVIIQDDPQPIDGTHLIFADAPWIPEVVDHFAVFSGLDVTVDGRPCPRCAFLSKDAVHHPELGCRIEICDSSKLSQWHQRVCGTLERILRNTLVNFHGQVLCLKTSAYTMPGLRRLVELTGEPTGIRLMLPARTGLVRNEAARQLKAALELEEYRFIQRRGAHSLDYDQFLRARELGVELPEATPTYNVGLIYDEFAPPIESVVPNGLDLARGYVLSEDLDPDTDGVNAHLLAALCKFDPPFVPVSIRECYMGYSWAALPTITKVALRFGKKLLHHAISDGELTCVESITITVRTSDGRELSAPVCAAVPTCDTTDERPRYLLCVTPEAYDILTTEQIWHHLGGWDESGDTYDTQKQQVAGQLRDFFAQLIGPHESLRRQLLECLSPMGDKWIKLTLWPDGKLSILHKDGTKETLPKDTP